MGSTLFWMGRFADARTWLPSCAELGWILALLGEPDAALALPEDAPLHFYRDAAAACLRCLPPPGEATALDDLLRYWAHSRLGQRGDEAAAQRALATLRRNAPCDAARGLAIHAIAAFHQHPAYALPHLDHALDQFARFGLHHLEARLLEYKAQALDAGGQLGEANRFLKAAAQARRRKVSQ